MTVVMADGEEDGDTQSRESMGHDHFPNHRSEREKSGEDDENDIIRMPPYSHPNLDLYIHFET